MHCSLVVLHAGVAQAVPIDVQNDLWLESNDLTEINALKQRPVAQSLVFMLDICRFTLCGGTTTSGMRATLASSSAVRQCSRVKIRGPL